MWVFRGWVSDLLLEWEGGWTGRDGTAASSVQFKLLRGRPGLDILVPRRRMMGMT